MNEFIQSWKEEHAAIIDALVAAIRLRICTEEGQKKMREVKELLLKHLTSEDDNLYPVLRKAAERNPTLQRTLELFAKDMEKIASTVSVFFKEYEKNPEAADLSSELGTILVALCDRISKEENIFIKEYKNISN